MNTLKELKAKLKASGVKNSKVLFADKYYGAMLKSESIRFDNLWAGYITDEQFIINLTEFTNDVHKDFVQS